MKVALLSITIFLISSTMYAAPAETTADEVYCDIGAAMMDDIIKLRADGKEQKYTTAAITLMFLNQVSANEKAFPDVDSATRMIKAFSSQLVNLAYTMDQFDAKKVADTPDLEINLYAGCIRDGFSILEK